MTATTIVNSLDESAVSAHVAQAIAGAKAFDDPAPYIFVENVLPQAVYERAMDAYDRSAEAFEEQIHRGDPKIFFGSYRDRLEFKLPEALERIDAETAAFWASLKRALERTAVIAALADRFAAGFEGRFGRDFDASRANEKMRSTLMVTKHRENYYLGPHTDRFEKVITCVINCAEQDGLEHLGTALYRPKAEGFTCNGVVHHDPRLFDLIGVVPFRPNTALMFHRDDRLFHGVEKLTSASTMRSERRNIQLNFWQL